MSKAFATWRSSPGSRCSLVAVVLVVGILLIGSDVIGGGGMFGIDARVARAIRTAPPEALGLARLGQLLGQRWLLALALLATVWLYVGLAADRRAALRSLLVLAALLGTASGVVASLKYATGRPAPRAFAAGTDGAPVLFRGGRSLPSGHVVNGTVAIYVLLLLAASLRRAPWLYQHGTRALGIAVAAGTVNGVCVVVLDFHWASDVVLGLILAALLIIMQQAVCPWPAREERGAATQAPQRHVTVGGSGPR